MDDFAKYFEHLTGHPPFPWQVELYTRWIGQAPRNGNTPQPTRFPQFCNVPTGLGKTSVIAVWLLALAKCPGELPRRLVYVVNRRTVVDQTTDEVEMIRVNLRDKPELAEIKSDLAKMCAVPSVNDHDFVPLAISTLRGQYADNREWTADPSRPAVICGTVDMIGSRLLFSGYGVGFKGRPLHAGFLGQDSLIVHDEAHLEPAFQKLLVDIEREQTKGRFPDRLPLRVLELTATSRGGGTNESSQDSHTITDKDRANETVKQRIFATKKLFMHEQTDAKPGAQLAKLAIERFKDSGKAILIFTRTIDDVKMIVDALDKAKLKSDLLIGPMRGLERDRLTDPRNKDGSPIFARFLSPPKPDATGSELWKVTPAQGTVYLVCTSAGEVGVNISADHLVCDLSTFDSMAQRFGRVNRFGKNLDTEIHVVSPFEFGKKDKETGKVKADELHERRKLTRDLLIKLPAISKNVYDASPAALSNLPETDRIAAFAPPPVILPTSGILFDAWAMTSIRAKMPGRPPVEPYLHGLPTDWQPPETYVAWREEVAEIPAEMHVEYDPEELLNEYPLKPHELLRDRFDRVHKELGNIAKRWQGTIWLLDDAGGVEVVELGKVAEKDGKDRLPWKTVLLPPTAGGLSIKGLLDGEVPPPSEGSLDIADDLFLKNESEELVHQRKRIWNNDWDEETDPLHEVVTIRFPGSEDSEDSEEKIWHWLRLINEGDRTAKKPVLWEVHIQDVVEHTQRIVENVPLEHSLKEAIILAAKYHDHGKRRPLFQNVLGNSNPNIILAKSGNKESFVRESYRHEFGSMLDIEKELKTLSLGEYQDLVLHLIAAHHGYARPHFPAENSFDPEHKQNDAERVASEVPRRFARLQRKYGRWGLAYLESLLRAADWAASANPSAYYEEGQ